MSKGRLVTIAVRLRVTREEAIALMVQPSPTMLRARLCGTLLREPPKDQHFPTFDEISHALQREERIRSEISRFPRATLKPRTMFATTSIPIAEETGDMIDVLRRHSRRLDPAARFLGIPVPVRLGTVTYTAAALERKKRGR